MKSSIRDTNNFVKDLLDNEELKVDLGYNLIQRFIQIYPEIRKELNLFIHNKFIDIVYPKIERFKDDIETKIVDLFVKIIEENNKKLKYKLSSEIYELIPKKLDSPFKAIIAEIFDNDIKEINNR